MGSAAKNQHRGWGMKKIATIVTLFALTACTTGPGVVAMGQSVSTPPIEDHHGIDSSKDRTSNEDKLSLARNYLRCAAFYVFGSTSVNRPELKKQLGDLANSSLYSAE